MIGAGYGSVFIFALIAFGIYWPFNHQPVTWPATGISCEFWYLLSGLFILVFFSGILVAVGSWYKTEREKMCYQMNTSLLRDAIHMSTALMQLNLLVYQHLISTIFPLLV